MQFVKMARGGQTVECSKVEIARDASFPGGYCVRGITRRGAIARYPIDGTTLDGEPVPALTAADKWNLAAERTPILPGESKAELRARMEREGAASGGAPAPDEQPAHRPFDERHVIPPRKPTGRKP